MKIMTQSPE